jgi:hypothetical protein
MEKEKTFLQDYMSKLTSQIMLIHPEYDRKVIYKIVKEKCKEKYNNPIVELDDNEVPLMTLVNNLRKKDYIISGSGSLFYQHKDKMSVEWFLTDDLGNKRKEYKKIKLNNIERKDKDPEAMKLFMLGENYQLSFKLLGNSYYGVNLESNSFFYNPWCGPAITQTGQFIIITAISTFERFAGSNFFFKRIDDIGIYVNNILKEDYDIKDFVDKKFFKKNNVRNLLYDWITSKCDNKTISKPSYEEYMFLLLNNLSEEEQAKVYFKNNLQEFIKNSSDVKEVLMDIMLNNEDFLDTNNPSKEYKESLDWLWDIFRICVAYFYTDFYQDYNAQYKGRKAVLTVKWCQPL